MDREALNHIREADLSARSAELVIDGQSLLIGHAHIHSVEPIADVRVEPGHGQAVGVLEFGEDSWSVFALDRDLDILADVPANRRACVLLKTEHGGVGFLCDEVHVVDNDSLAMVPVPGCMQGEESLMDSLAVVDGKITCVLAADRLSAMLRGQTSDDAAEPRAAPGGSR